MEGQNVTIAGRLMTKRGMGKVILLRPAGRAAAAIQLYVRKDRRERRSEFARFPQV